MKSKKATANKPPSAARRMTDILGKIALIGLTYYKENQPPELKQLYGKVIKVTRRGITVELDGLHKGEVFGLPPGIRAFKHAEPGYYRFCSSEDGVENPDFIVTYCVYYDEETYKTMNSE